MQCDIIAIGGEPSSTRERCKTSIELQTEIDFLKRQIEVRRIVMSYHSNEGFVLV